VVLLDAPGFRDLYETGLVLRNEDEAKSYLSDRQVPEFIWPAIIWKRHIYLTIRTKSVAIAEFNAGNPNLVMAGP
jgi:hypothetical protein